MVEVSILLIRLYTNCAINVEQEFPMGDVGQVSDKAPIGIEMPFAYPEPGVPFSGAEIVADDAHLRDGKIALEAGQDVGGHEDEVAAHAAMAGDEGVQRDAKVPPSRSDLVNRLAGLFLIGENIGVEIVADGGEEGGDPIRCGAREMGFIQFVAGD